MKPFIETGVSYFANRHLGHFITDLKALKKEGFNSILHTFSEEDLLYSRGNVKDMVKSSHDMGFTVWINPWAAGGVFDGESFSGFLLENQKAWQLMSDNKKYPAACLNNPVFRQYMKNWADAAVSMGVDAVMWDEPGFKTKQNGKKAVWSCRCPYCRESYELQNMTAMPVFKLDESVIKFRENSVKKFISDLSIHVKFISGGRVNVSAVITQPSATVDRISSKNASRLCEICAMSGKKPHFWLRGYGYKNGTESQILQAIKGAKDAGIKNIWVRGYKGGEIMSSLASDNPDRTWKAIVVRSINKYEVSICREI